MISATKECYKGTHCKEEYPLLFNKRCYNKENCPENTIYKEESPKTCSCIKYYYLDSQNNIICLPENENSPDDPDYPNLIFPKNKCVKNEDNELNGYFPFNGIYYNNCPLYTEYEDESKKCICNNIYGYWYKESDKLECGQRKCPDNKNYYKIDTKECVNDCEPSDEYKYKYNGICYKKCPDLTEPNEELVCELMKTSNSENLVEFTHIIKNNIVNLYKGTINKESENEEEESDSKVIELVNSDYSAIEFYGVNKNKKENKNKHNDGGKTSSLSFIDLSECIQKNI